MQNLMNNKLEIDVGIKDAFIIGQTTPLVEMENLQEKLMVMRNKSKLRNIKRERIFNNNSTKKEKQI